jgi:hypothetical protein
MTLNIKRAKSSQDQIDQVIDAGGSVPNREKKVDEKKDISIDKADIRFTVSMPQELASVIDKLRKPSKTSRQAWLMQAAIEKLEREGKI